MKKVLIAFLGFLHGIFGSYWGLLGIAFTFPESTPDSKDYEEDRLFVPLGIVMLLIYAIATIISYYKLRKSMFDIILFSVALIIGIAIFSFLLYNHNI